MRTVRDRDVKTGQFLPLPKGQKTPKMLEIEKRLGRSLEEDYQEHYIKEGWGQKKIANRWRVPKGLIFFGNRRNNTAPWTEKLSLPVRNPTVAPAVAAKNRTGCEICGEDRVIAHRAHWIANTDGGSTQRFNIIRLCPNHHQLLDGGDQETTELAKQILLARETKRIIETGPDSPEKRKELVRVSQAIITRRVS
jgi:hypothetical protein